MFYTNLLTQVLYLRFHRVNLITEKYYVNDELVPKNGKIFVIILPLMLLYLYYKTSRLHNGKHLKTMKYS